MFGGVASPYDPLDSCNSRSRSQPPPANQNFGRYVLYAYSPGAITRAVSNGVHHRARQPDRRQGGWLKSKGGYMSGQPRHHFEMKDRAAVRHVGRPKARQERRSCSKAPCARWRSARRPASKVGYGTITPGPAADRKREPRVRAARQVLEPSRSSARPPSSARILRRKANSVVAPGACDG